ncbi:MAG: hypothetical protein ACE5H8_14800 [Alphaproteobacteria bacterium]
MSSLPIDTVGDTPAERKTDGRLSLRATIAVWIAASAAGWAVVIAALSALV